MGQTWTGPGAGEEQRTLQQANQSFNRAAGKGQYVPPEGPAYDAQAAATYGKDPEKLAKAAEKEAERAGTLFQNQLLTLGAKDPTTGRSLPIHKQPGWFQDLHATHAPQTVAEVPGTMEKIKPLVEGARSVDLFNNPETRVEFRAQALNAYRQDAAAADKPVDSQIEKYILTTPVTMQNVGMFRTAYEKGAPRKVTVPPGIVSSAEGAEGAVASTIDRLSLLGKKFGYELQPGPNRVGGTEPTLQSVRQERLRNRERIFNPPPGL
jgi:hypothetical protein